MLLQPLTTVIRLNNVVMAPLAESLARTLNGVTTHGGICRGLLGHVPATGPTLVKLEGELVNWNHQFGPTLPTTLPAGRRAALAEQTGGDWLMTDGSGDTEITIRTRRR
jgi:hypothetical protein